MIRCRVVAGPVQIGAGEVVRLTEAQYAPRAHNVDVVSRSKDKTMIDVRGKAPLDFKTGEEIGLAVIPKYLAERIVDLDAEARAAHARARAEAEAKARAEAEAKAKAQQAPAQP